MACELCGGGDVWIKTCVTPEGSRLKLITRSMYGRAGFDLLRQRVLGAA